MRVYRGLLWLVPCAAVDSLAGTEGDSYSCIFDCLPCSDQLTVDLLPGYDLATTIR